MGAAKRSNIRLSFLLGIVVCLILIVFISIYTCRDKRSMMVERINAPVNYTPVGILSDIKIVNTSTATRRAVNLEVPGHLTNSDLDAEIRYAIDSVYQMFPNVNAIKVKVFEAANNMSIATGVFAPYGDWAVTSFPDREFYQVKISINR